jgi:multiple sugar transport system permease protein
MTSRRVQQVITVLLLALLAAPFVVPLLWTLGASLRPTGLGSLRTFEWFPAEPAWSNYLRVVELVPMARYALNTLVIAALAVPISLLTGTWAGFALAQLPSRWRAPVVVLSLAMLLVPGPALWLPRYVLFTRLGLLDTIWPLIAPAFMGLNPIFVLLFYWSFRRIPADLYDAARAEGAGLLQIWWRVGLPQVRPMLVTVGILAFVFEWNDFIDPLLFLHSSDKLTLSVGLHTLQQMTATNWPILMAGSVLVILPVVLLYLVAQRYFLHAAPPEDIGL